MITLRCISLLIAISIPATFTLADPPPDLLGGPTIEDEPVDPRANAGAAAKEAGRRDGERRQTRAELQIWATTMRELDLRDDQREGIDAIFAEWEAAQRAFGKEHGSKLRDVQRDRPRDETTREQRAEHQEKLAEIMKMAPDAVAYQKRAWKLLDVLQQTDFQQRFDKRMQETRDAAQKRRDGQPGMTDAMEGGGDAPMQSPRSDREMDRDGSRRHVAGDQLDDSSLRRIRFLRRLQALARSRRPG